MQFTKISVYLLAISLIILFICDHSLAASGAIKSAGCKTEIYLLKDIVEAYEAQTGKSIRLGRTGNKKAIELLLDQEVDFTFTCQPIEKLAKGMELGEKVSSWRSIALAKDPIVIVANSKNGISHLTTEELKKIFQGQYVNWKDLGGNDLPIQPAYLSDDLESGLVLLFKEFTVGAGGELTEKALQAQSPDMLGNYVSVTPGAIGFLNYNTYNEKYGDILSVDGVQPSPENIMTGAYPLTATYFLTIDGSNNQAVMEFIGFARSEAGKSVIRKNYVPISQ